MIISYVKPTNNYSQPLKRKVVKKTPIFYQYMEIHFQPNHYSKPQPNQITTNNMSNIPQNKLSKFKGKRNSNNKFVGVRQRPSGRWVAEIKDTTQKIRMWLGTFETAEAAARAYDEAACLLRGSNTRTNFVNTHVSPNSQIASRIKNLLKNKNVENEKSNVVHNNIDITPPKPNTIVSPLSNINNTFINPNNSLVYTNSICGNNNVNLLNSNFVHGNVGNYIDDQTRVYDDVVFRPESSGYVGNYDQLVTCSSSHQYGIVDQCDIKPNLDKLTLSQEMLEITPKDEVMSPLLGPKSSEFERLLMEKDMMVSTSFFTGNNGVVQEYVDFFNDPLYALWDFPPICPSFCSF